MHGIPRAPGCRAYSSVGREVGAVCVERLAVFVPSLPHPLLSTVYQCDGCLSYLGRGGSWLGCQVWPAISAVSILELVTNSGSSRMSRAPNLHSLRATKLFMVKYLQYCKLFKVVIFIILKQFSQGLLLDRTAHVQASPSTNSSSLRGFQNKTKGS